MDKKEIAKSYYQVITDCWKLLKLCVEHSPLTDKQIDGAVKEVIRIGESNNAKPNENFTRKMALLVLDEIENANKVIERG